ncbi:class I SAM-dependent methyltransferase [Nocardiopsis coralliicola]
MPDAEYAHPRLAALYDHLHADPSDLPPYLEILRAEDARDIIDAGCGTGRLTLALAARGCTATGFDPARASLDVARAKPGADRVRWVHGDSSALAALDPPLRADAAVMAGNASQAVDNPAQWRRTLTDLHAALRPGGLFAFETRNPDARAWERWNRAESLRTLEVPGTGPVTVWVDLLDVDGPLVAFRWTFAFADGQELTSTSTLRFRTRAETSADLAAAGFTVEEVRGAPDRPGRELVFLARRP